jgi:zona occludens toxin
MIIQSRKGTYKEEIYQFYRSATNSETFTVGDESVSDKRGNLWTSKWLWFCIIFGLIAVIAGPIYIIKGFFGGYAKEIQQVTRAAVPAAQFVNPGSDDFESLKPVDSQPERLTNEPSDYHQQPLNPGEPPRSTFWRVGGFIDAWSKQDANVRPSVILIGPTNEHRVISMDTCQQEKSYMKQGRSIYIYCDIDGERVTFWSGRTNVTNVIDGLPMGKAVGDAVSEPRERSASPTAAAHPAASVVPVNVVPDTSRTARTLIGNNP